MRRVFMICALLASPIFAGADVLADESTAVDEQAFAVPSLTLSAGQLAVDGMVLVNFSKGDIGEPLSVSPDLWYGLNDDITVGLVHSLYGVTGFWGIDTLGAARGPSLCISSPSDHCVNVYDNFALLGRFSLFADGNLQIAAAGGLVANTFDPFALSVKVGLLFRASASEVVRVDVAPSLFVGLSQRGNGNVERVFLPMTVSYAVTSQVGLLGQLGLSVQFEDVVGSISIPVSVGATYAVTEAIVLAAVFSLPAVIGGDNVGSDGVDGRALTLGIRWVH